MAAIICSSEISASTSTPPTRPTLLRRATAPTTSASTASPLKLRDSCHACASSKVKCHKEKPTCSRCAKRGLTCEYFVTKRAGRKHDPNRRNIQNQNQNHSQKQTQSQSQHQESENTTTGSSDNIMSTINIPESRPAGLGWPASSAPPTITAPTAGDSFLIPSTTSLDLSLQQNPISPASLTSPEYNVSSHSTFPNLLSPSNLGSDFDDFFTSDLNFGTGDTQIPSGDLDIMDLLMQPTHNFTALDEAFLPADSVTTVEHTPNDGATCGNSCLIRTLRLLKSLFPLAPPSCHTVAACPPTNVPIPPPQPVNSSNSNPPPIALVPAEMRPTLDATIKENYTTLESVSEMLGCGCANDWYVLMVISLVVFRVMGGYESAVRKVGMGVGDNHLKDKSEGNDEGTANMWSRRRPAHFRSSSFQSFDDDDEEDDKARVAAQLVLSELHRVQRIVNLLSAKLRTKTKGSPTVSQECRDGRTRSVSQRNLFSSANGSANTTPESTSSSNSETIMGSVTSSILDPFSDKMLEQLDCDLRKRLKGLSLEIRIMLR
ncbi:hypothetical protein GQ43DRAFT_471676 [Delitschia confertaspora ATCC 74209]|uniref:Zn(2)-C6 fungal-type domain-containing protein n=1 Tax=Delitschia confertaspora ATCC 74209 TaxID=1513339 RepID=A0A9P4JS59_9PLEO|nr:hypothetical protein GQ43DRAFT_471676 [Delitschia confertaspora ATCC 74209]